MPRRWFTSNASTWAACFTRDGQVVEFWFQGEKENSAGLHSFVKEYAFTRCWARFKPSQGDLPMKGNDGK
jgi:hypothetical protein